MYDASYVVEGVEAKKVSTLAEAFQLLIEGKIPILNDKNGNIIESLMSTKYFDYQMSIYLEVLSLLRS